MKKTIGALLVAGSLSAALVSAWAVGAKTGAKDETLRDIRETVGVVPTLVDAYPDAGLAALWEKLRDLQLSSNTALPVKTKHLIALAVASQVPDDSSAYVYSEFAELYGATEREREEAIALAGMTRHWSTVLNGSGIRLAEYRPEIDRIMEFLRSGASKPGPLASITDAESAYRDARATFGTVPSFLKAYPEASVAAAWKQFRAMQVDPGSALPAKDKELVGLAVAAQIPCEFCTYFHTQAAKLNGATRDEIAEAVGMASLTVEGSTILHGNLVDPVTFRKEVDAMTSFARERDRARERGTIR